MLPSSLSAPATFLPLSGECQESATVSHDGGSARVDQLDRVAKHLTALLLQTPIGVAITDSTGSFSFVNAAFCAITGYTERELRSMSWVSLTHPDDRELNFTCVCRALEGSLPSFVIEKRYVTKVGATVWVRNSVFLMLDDAGDYAGAIAFAEDITELKRAQQARRAMSSYLLRIQDEERRRIARELHDSTGQTLAGLLMILAPLKNELAALSPTTRKAVSDGIALAKKAACEVRTFSYLLHPPLLDELGLLNAIRSYVQGFRERSGMEVKLLLPRSLPLLSPGIDLALFRVLQESLNNARLHSGSSRVIIRLHLGDGRLLLTVRDFGRGWQASKRRKKAPGVGIAGMRERVRQLGGRLQVIPDKGGTVVHASIPLRAHGCASLADCEPSPAIPAGR
jgi:two-component system, NarL family, sensor kinase